MIAQLDKEQIRLRPSRAAARLISHILLQGRPLTTNGRWLNHLLFPQYKLVQKLPQLKTVQKPIFILGTGRSGTTILGKLLSLHPQLCFLNEPKAMWHIIHPAEDLIGSYTRMPAKYRLDQTDASPKTIQTAHRLYGYALTITHSRRVLDKYPEMIFRIPFIKAIFPDARLLFLVRNGWDTAQSINTWSQNEKVQVNQENHDWWGANNRKWQLLLRDIVAEEPDLKNQLEQIKNFSSQADMGAVEWLVTMREGLANCEKYPNDLLKVHYEALVENPSEILAEILSFCQLPEDSTLLQYAQRTVRLTPPKPPVILHPAIAKPFNDTMNQLGYETRKSQ